VQFNVIETKLLTMVFVKTVLILEKYLVHFASLASPAPKVKLLLMGCAKTALNLGMFQMLNA